MPETQAVTNFIKRYTNHTPAIFVNATKTTLSSGPYAKIQFLTNGNLKGIVSTQIVDSSKISSGTTYAAGTVIFANMTNIQLTSKGRFLIYKWS